MDKQRNILNIIKEKIDMKMILSGLKIEKKLQMEIL